MKAKEKVTVNIFGLKYFFKENFKMENVLHLAKFALNLVGILTQIN